MSRNSYSKVPNHSGINPFKTAEQLEQEKRFLSSDRLIAANLANIGNANGNPSRKSSSMSLSAYQKASNASKDNYTRTLLSSPNRYSSYIPTGVHSTSRMQHLDSVVEDKKAEEAYNKHSLISSGLRSAADTIKRSKALEGLIKQRTNDGLGGGYAKITKVGLLTRIMNIKKKAKAAKPTVRKATKPVKKPIKPTARKAAKPVKPVRRKPTIVRRK